MEIIHQPRNSGKTTKLVTISHKTGQYIVCQNLSEAQRIVSFARTLGLTIPFPITYGEFLDKSYYGLRIDGLLFDNIENFVQSLTSTPITVGTITIAQDTKELLEKRSWIVIHHKNWLVKVIEIEEDTQTVIGSYFNHHGGYEAYAGVCETWEFLRKATPEEVKKALIGEAEKRNLTAIGTNLFKIPNGDKVEYFFPKGIIGDVFIYDPDKDRLTYLNAILYEDGKWSEILDLQ